MRLLGLQWTTGSIVASNQPPPTILEQLRVLWEDHGNIGALRDAFWLCGKMTEPPLAMPTWLVDAIDTALLNSDTTKRWRMLLSRHD